MDDAAVLQAGTSHWAWDEAVLRLVSTGLEKDAAESWLLARHWTLTRVADHLYASLTQNILSYGLWGEFEQQKHGFQDRVEPQKHKAEQLTNSGWGSEKWG